MATIMLIFVVAFAVTGASTPWARRLAIFLGLVDAPAQRKLHSTPMPLMGGLAIFLGAVVAIMALALELTPLRAPQVQGILVASGVMVVVGLADDRVGLPPWVKFVAQFVGFLVLVSFGVRVRLPIPLWLNYVITLIWLVGMSNAINFLDNMDGLSAGVSAVIAAFTLLVAALNGQHLVGGLASAVLGATLGFLRYNFRPAQIFMGDAGALFLGFLLAVLGLQLRFPENSSFVTWMVPLLLMGVPIFDMSLVVFSRLRRGLNPMTAAGKDHTSHRLVHLGFSQREAVLILYLMSGVFGMFAIFITKATLLEGYVVGVLVAVFCAVLIWRLERLWSKRM